MSFIFFNSLLIYFEVVGQASCIFWSFLYHGLWYNCCSKTKADNFWKIIHFFLPHYFFFVPKKEVIYINTRGWALSSAEVSDHTEWVVTMKGEEGFLLGVMYVCFLKFRCYWSQSRIRNNQTYHFSHYCWSWSWTTRIVLRIIVF